MLTRSTHEEKQLGGSGAQGKGMTPTKFGARFHKEVLGIMSGASKSKLLWKNAEDEDQMGRGDVIGMWLVLELCRTSQSREPTYRSQLGVGWDKAICSCRGTNTIFCRSYGLEYLLNRRATVRLLLERVTSQQPSSPEIRFRRVLDLMTYDSAGKLVVRSTL